MQSAKNLQNLEELTLLKVRLKLVLEYFRNGNFREFWYWAVRIFQFQDEFQVALVDTENCLNTV